MPPLANEKTTITDRHQSLPRTGFPAALDLTGIFAISRPRRPLAGEAISCAIPPSANSCYYQLQRELAKPAATPLRLRINRRSRPSECTVRRFAIGATLAVAPTIRATAKPPPPGNRQAARQGAADYLPPHRILWYVHNRIAPRTSTQEEVHRHVDIPGYRLRRPVAHQVIHAARMPGRRPAARSSVALAVGSSGG